MLSIKECLGDVGKKRLLSRVQLFAHFLKIIEECEKNAEEEPKVGQKRGRSFCMA
jgi:hypothetical protein